MTYIDPNLCESSSALGATASSSDFPQPRLESSDLFLRSSSNRCSETSPTFSSLSLLMRIPVSLHHPPSVVDTVAHKAVDGNDLDPALKPDHTHNHLPAPAEPRVRARECWRLLRYRTRQLTRGLTTTPSASMLHKDFWLEALDTQHRYGFHLRAFHRAWKDDTSAAVDRRSASFFFWLDHGAGRALELPECSRQSLASMRVEYCDAAARCAYEVTLAAAGAVYTLTQQPVHTDALSKWIFVVALDKRLYVGRKRKGVFHHSSFVAGAPILAAGKLMVRHGHVVAIEPHSGHYKPTSRNLTALCDVLRSHGVALADVAFIQPKKWASAWPFPDRLPAHLDGCELEDLASDTDYCS